MNVAPSNYLVTVFQKRGFTTQFIANSIDLQHYHYKQRQYLQPTLLWVRAFDKIYNPLMAIEVLTLLKQQYPKACLCMIGPDKDGSLEEVKLVAKQLGMQESIEFTGGLSKKEWIKKSENFDIFINTTTIDNTPVSVLEAMALGLPIVSTNVGGIPYLLKSGEQALLIENKNATEMMQAILKLIQNPELVEYITKNAKNRVAEFDTVVVQQKWLKLMST
jgi:glycosyltransferase involved in cell wall biosynthesis